MDRTGQMGVPVITVDGDVVVGFDQARLDRLIASAGSGSRRLGASVAPANGGLRVGQVHPGSLAEKAGLKAGDFITTFDGDPVATPEQLSGRLARPRQRGVPLRIGAQRDGKTVELWLPAD